MGQFSVEISLNPGSVLGGNQHYRLLTRAMPDWERIKSRLDDMAEVLLND